jgi:hypothetical protein
VANHRLVVSLERWGYNPGGLVGNGDREVALSVNRVFPGCGTDFGWLESKTCVELLDTSVIGMP